MASSREENFCDAGRCGRRRGASVCWRLRADPAEHGEGVGVKKEFGAAAPAMGGWERKQNLVHEKLERNLAELNPAIHRRIQHITTISRNTLYLQFSHCPSLLEEAGSFASKNYPHSYTNNLYQEWSISIDVGKHIRLVFTYFDIQVTEECDSDYLIIDDPLRLDEMRHCGTCIPEPYISVGNTLHVFFMTDFAIYRTGFSAKYESVADRSGSVEPAASDVLPSDWLEIGDGIKQISVSTSTNQVWALDIDGKPLRRTGISQSTPQGTGWEVVGTEQFLYISVGQVGVWAVYNHSTVMYRVGTIGSDETAGTSWQAVHIDSKITNSLFNFKTFPVETDWLGHSIDQIHSGKDYVWIVATYPHFTYGYTIVRQGITSDNPEGTSWDSVQTANMKEVSVSSRTGQLWAVEIGGRVWRSPFYCEISMSVGRSGVWAVDFEGEVHHRAGTFLNETAPGVAWIHVPGVHLQQIGVGDRTVWGVDSSQQKRLCAEDEVICPYSEKCIKECRVCDGIVDCGDDDDTDERNCWFANCPEKHRRVCAGEVGCYSPTRVCDGERNCGDITEDERDCPDSCVHHGKRNYLLQRDEIQCRDLSDCVKITKVCDGQKDCSDGSDEVNCYEFCSLHGSFGDTAYWKCRDSPGCVKGEFLCNGVSDCADGSDEENCDELCRSIGYWPCKNSIPPFPRCIKGSGRCNRAVQCRDFSDEIGCGIIDPSICERCPHFENTCLPRGSDSYCDTIIQCDNGEDEENCDDFCDREKMSDCQTSGWTCTCDQIAGCYVPEDICDGRKQCHSLAGNDCHDDEQHCEEYCRTVGGFDCGPPWHQCISLHRVCDEHPDCNYMDNATMEFYGPADEQHCGTCDGYRDALDEYRDKRKEKGLTTSDSYDHTCRSGKCAATFNLCDDRDFCGNWEDEQDCETVGCHHDDRKCEATKKCVSDLSCNGLPGCLDSTDEKDCDITTCMDTAVRLGVSDQYKEIEVTQNCDGKDDCRTGVDENPRRCAMYTDRLPCVKSNRFVSSNSFCNGFPDCHDVSDEDACIVKDYTVTEGFGVSPSNHGSRGQSLTEWEVDSLEDWLQITLEHPVQLAAVVVSGPRSSHSFTFTLKYGRGTDCLTTYMEGGGIKVFQTSTAGANSDEHHLASAVYTRVVKLIPQFALDKTVLEVGLLGCPIKDQHVKDKFCGKGWTMFEDSCYRKFSSPLVWWAAERYCQALGGHLAAVNTPRENEFLRSDIGNGWIGLKLDAVVMKKQRERINDLSWSNGSPAGDAFKEENIDLDAFQEYLWRLSDPFCAFLELHGPWSLHPCSLLEKEFICEKDPSSHSGDDTKNTTQCFDGDLAEIRKGDINADIPDMTVCDDCMARETSCGNIRCGLPDDYRCGLIYSPGYPATFPPSALCLWTIDGPPGSFVTLLLLDVDLPGYSSGVCTSRVLQVRDRFLTVGWNTIHGLCRGEDEQKLYVSSSNDMQLAMLATSNSADISGSRGFMATFNISTFSPSRQVHNLPDDAGFICPCGWHLFRRNCYQTFRQSVPLNWVESDLKCREYGANLTSVSDRQEMEFLHVLLVTNVVVKRIADPTLFIGFYDVYRTRAFVWTDGIPVTYTDWSRMDLRTGFPQPDGAKINFCVAIVMKNVRETDQWYDVACDERDTRSFICKQAAERVTRQGNNS
ncbi:hypothetical protein Bbelb_343530 [Branchiostoma belcheri]|nr:hypothetical protein Bbelb_343530 [Branchiostoma belcheri]